MSEKDFAASSEAVDDDNSSSVGNFKRDSDSNEASSDDEGDLNTFDRYWPIPDTSSTKLIASNGCKTVSAFTFNNAGTRFAAGAYDYETRIWDFGSIDPQCPSPMSQVQPSGQTVIKNLDYTNDDELILVISSGCQAVIIAKDGTSSKDNQCAKGDQYLSDMTNTKGHVQMLNDGCWHPKDKQTFMTSSNDCTIRLWDANKLSQQKSVIKIRSQATGQKAVPNACKFSRDAMSLITGTNDGSLLLWDTRRKFITTSASVRNAHAKASEIVGLDVSYGQTKLVSRSEDGTCKLWDLRQLRQPLAKRAGLSTLAPLVDCTFSPDDKTIMSGVASPKAGKLLFLDVETLDTKRELESQDCASVIRSKWHPKINHICYTTSGGSLVVLYSDRASVGGLVGWASRRPAGAAAAAANKRKKYVTQRDRSDTVKPSQIITPHALPLFRDTNDPNRRHKSAKLAYRPEVPVAGASQGGRVKPAGSTLSSYIAQNIAKPKDDGGVGIRERILRHADEAQKNPIWVAATSKQTDTSSGGKEL